jgi:DNA primase
MNFKMTLSPDELQLLREVRIHKILGINDNGRRISMRCPLPNHRDGTPSFTLYPENNYYCFGCGAVGNGAIDFCMELGFSFQESCNELIKYI